MRTEHFFAAAHLVTAVVVLGGCLPAVEPHTTPSPDGGLDATRPRLVVEDRPYWATGFEAAYAVTIRNLHEAGSYHRTRHAHASPAIRGVHLWDSAFLSQIWRGWDAEVAQDVLRAVLQKADRGRVPHFSHRILRSRLTQPPVLAWSVWENHRWSDDLEYLRSVYPALKEYNGWLYEQRRLPSGLFFWASHLESGKDNSPRFDAGDTSSPGDLRRIAAVDLSSYVALQNASLARIAAELDLEAERELFESRAEELRVLMNAHLWDEDTRLYYDRNESTGRLIRIKTPASLLPLLAGVPDSARARALRDHAIDPRSFNTLIPLPSVAIDERSFSKDMWRGPVWINVSYMIIRGLESYGYHEEAAELAFRTVDGVFRTYEQTGGVWEFYDPERFDTRELNRKRGNIGKQLTLGNQPLPHYGWSGLVNTLVVELLVGYGRDRGSEWISPRLPPAAAGSHFELEVPGRELKISLRREADGMLRGQWTRAGAGEAFVMRSAERLPLHRDMFVVRDVAPGDPDVSGDDSPDE